MQNNNTGQKHTFPNKTTYNQIIPANIFQTWHTKILPPKMYAAVKYIKLSNPGFKHYLFDDNDCRQFIQKHFDSSVLNAYDRLIPGAYKADLWRYCVLYKLGGVYIDIKYYPINNFKLINLLEEEHWVLDLDSDKIYNALMVCKAGNEILLKAINKIVENVRTRFYGSSFLEPTGPRLLKQYFSADEKKAFKIRHICENNRDDGKYILFNNIPIFRCYNGYFAEREKASKKQHYGILWKRRQIYL